MKFSFLFLCFSLTLFAQELKIQANYFESDEKKGISIFQGNVHIKKGYDEINASKVTIFINQKRKPYKFIASGNVSFKIKVNAQESYKGKAQKVIYIPNKKQYKFYTDVYIKQIGKNKQISGDEVVLDASNGKAHANGTNQPVTMTFEIEEEKKGN